MSEERRLSYVANVRTCIRVGVEQWQFYTKSAVLDGTETVAELIKWAESIDRDGANIELVKAESK